MSNVNDVVTPASDGHAAPDLVADAAAQPPAIELPPLVYSALMVTKADLIAALRLFLPPLTDVEQLDGDRFLLSVGAVPTGESDG